MLAAYRRAADAAGVDWKSADHRKVEEEVKACRGLKIQRMVGLGRVSGFCFYRFGAARAPGPDAGMGLPEAIQRIALEWPSYAGRGSPESSADAARQRIPNESIA